MILLTSNGGPPNDGTAAGKAVIAALMGLAGLVALWRVPRIMDSLLGGLSSSSAGSMLMSGRCGPLPDQPGEGVRLWLATTTRDFSSAPAYVGLARTSRT